jgi:hypothetical protein
MHKASRRKMKKRKVEREREESKSMHADENRCLRCQLAEDDAAERMSTHMMASPKCNAVTY